MFSKRIGQKLTLDDSLWIIPFCIIPFCIPFNFSDSFNSTLLNNYMTREDLTVHLCFQRPLIEFWFSFPAGTACKINGKDSPANLY